MSAGRARRPLRWGMVVAVAGAAVSLCMAGPAVAAADDGALQVLTAPAGNVHLLAPGESVDWPVTVTTDVSSLDSLIVQLTASGPLAELSKNSGYQKVASVELLSCRKPWQGARCASGTQLVLAPTLLGELAAPGVDLVDRSLPMAQEAHLLVRATLNKTAGTDIQGASAHVRLTATASGEISDGAVPPSSGALAKTGVELLPFLALAAFAIGAGVSAAAVARWRRVARGHHA